jgi:hypothetical protein
MTFTDDEVLEHLPNLKRLLTQQGAACGKQEKADAAREIYKYVDENKIVALSTRFTGTLMKKARQLYSDPSTSRVLDENETSHHVDAIFGPRVGPIIRGRSHGKL